MNRLTKYGLIAEIIGALAVVISLVFLAVEVRGHERLRISCPKRIDLRSGT